MKAHQNIIHITRLLGCDKSTISRELLLNAGCRGYKANLACELALRFSELSCNANSLSPVVKVQANALFEKN